MTNETVIGCSCANESCYLALHISTDAFGNRRISIVGNGMGLKEPVIIIDPKDVETLVGGLMRVSAHEKNSAEGDDPRRALEGGSGSLADRIG